MKIEMIIPQEDTTLQALEANQEGLQNDKAKTQHPTITPTDLLSKHKRPQHHKPAIIRAIRCTRNAQGQLVEDITYKGRRCLQLIEYNTPQTPSLLTPSPTYTPYTNHSNMP